MDDDAGGIGRVRPRWPFGRTLEVRVEGAGTPPLPARAGLTAGSLPVPGPGSAGLSFVQDARLADKAAFWALASAGMVLLAAAAVMATGVASQAGPLPGDVLERVERVAARVEGVGPAVAVGFLGAVLLFGAYLVQVVAAHRWRRALRGVAQALADAGLSWSAAGADAATFGSLPGPWPFQATAHRWVVAASLETRSRLRDALAAAGLQIQEERGTAAGWWLVARPTSAQLFSIEVHGGPVPGHPGITQVAASCHPARWAAAASLAPMAAGFTLAVAAVARLFTLLTGMDAPGADPLDPFRGLEEKLASARRWAILGFLGLAISMAGWGIGLNIASRFDSLLRRAWTRLSQAVEVGQPLSNPGRLGLDALPTIVIAFPLLPAAMGWLVGMDWLPFDPVAALLLYGVLASAVLTLRAISGLPARVARPANETTAGFLLLVGAVAGLGAVRQEVGSLEFLASLALALAANMGLLQLAGASRRKALTAPSDGLEPPVVDPRLWRAAAGAQLRMAVVFQVATVTCFALMAVALARLLAGLPGRLAGVGWDRFDAILEATTLLALLLPYRYLARAMWRRWRRLRGDARRPLPVGDGHGALDAFTRPGLADEVRDALAGPLWVVADPGMHGQVFGCAIRQRVGAFELTLDAPTFAALAPAQREAMVWHEVGHARRWPPGAEAARRRSRTRLLGIWESLILESEQDWMAEEVRADAYAQEQMAARGSPEALREAVQALHAIAGRPKARESRSERLSRALAALEWPKAARHPHWAIRGSHPLSPMASPPTRPLGAVPALPDAGAK